MKTTWDYTKLARAYSKRPDYSPQALERLFALTRANKGKKACDVGAGPAVLTLHLARLGMDVVAIEPNDAMRSKGQERTKRFENVHWVEATGEDTTMEDRSFDLVTFGSSFNVIDRQKGLAEVSRILKPDGWMACMWNHRYLSDPVQSAIEAIIKRHIPSYDYGIRRQDHMEVIMSSGLFSQCLKISCGVLHTQSIADCKEAWRSHATLERQSGNNFNKIIDDISNYIDALEVDAVRIPYMTNIWAAKLN